MAAAAPAQQARVLLHRYDGLAAGRLLRRYKRFLADVEFGAGGEVAVVHNPNTGAMTGLLDALPAACACSVSCNAARKYAHTLEFVRLGTGAAPGPWVCVHAALANRLAGEVLRQRLLPELGAYEGVKAEVKLDSSSKSRFDFMLTRANGAKVYVEVKSVTLATPHADWLALGQAAAAQAAAAAEPGAAAAAAAAPAARAPSGSRGRKRKALSQAVAASAECSSATAAKPLSKKAAAAAAGAAGTAAAAAAAAAAGHAGLVAQFPDAVSDRALRHVQELAAIQAGPGSSEAACLFLVMRPGCALFSPAWHIDPAYSAALRQAQQAGVKLLAVAVDPDPDSASIWFRPGSVLPVVL